MPRIRRGLDRSTRIVHPDLVAALADELRAAREAGQPMIEEFYFPGSEAIRVTVVWDRWDGVADEDRIEVIRRSYEQVEGKEFCDRITLAIGLTVPEAEESGLLPYKVIPLIRKGDPVSLEQCKEAMISQGASVLADPDRPPLRFATLEEAERCVGRLIKQLPASEPLWSIVKDVGSEIDVRRQVQSN